MAVVKQVNRVEKRLEPQPVAVEERHQLKGKRQNLFSRLQSLSFIFPRNRWLFRGFGLTLCVMLGATVALLIPIWSDLTRLNQGQPFSLGDAKPENSDFWSNSFQYQVSQPLNILVMGFGSQPGAIETSDRVFNRPSDAILLLRLDPIDKSVRVLSIPRDSQVVIPGIGLAKISLANNIGGSALAARMVSRTLNNVPIDGYVRITTNGLRELVELLGGVEVFVPQRISSENAIQQVNIDLEPGWQTLNGEQAEQFARFSDAHGGDIARIQRQQALLQALCDRLTNPTVLPRLPELSRVMLKYIDTNLTLEEIMALVNFGVEVEPQNFQMVMLPGITSRFSKDPSSYWLDAVGINQLMEEYFGVKAIGAAKKPSSPNTLKIAIQNASTQANLSQRLANYLKEQGFTNVYIGSDWPEQPRQTQIIVQKGDLAGAAAVQKALGLGSIEVTATGDLQSDLTIRVGKDWTSH